VLRFVQGGWWTIRHRDKESCGVNNCRRFSQNGGLGRSESTYALRSAWGYPIIKVGTFCCAVFFGMVLYIRVQHRCLRRYSQNSGSVEIAASYTKL
jgi:hypothetical protein